MILLPRRRFLAAAVGLAFAGAAPAQLPLPSTLQGGGDPFWNSVVLLVGNNNGADAATAFTDQSASAKAVTARGNVQWDNAQAPAGLSTSVLFDGSGDCLQLANSPAWAFPGDFTMECWIRYASVTNIRFASVDDLGANRRWLWGETGTNVIVGDTVGTNYQRAWVPSINIWYHVAWSRRDGVGRIFVDGVQAGTNQADTTSYATGALLQIGGWTPAGGSDLNGWLASVRITKGVGRYAAPFTPPTLPLPTS